MVPLLTVPSLSSPSNGSGITVASVARLAIFPSSDSDRVIQTTACTTLKLF